MRFTDDHTQPDAGSEARIHPANTLRNSFHEFPQLGFQHLWGERTQRAMSSATSAAGVKPQPISARQSRSGLRYGLILGGIAALLILGFLGTLTYVQVWPFSRKEVLQALSEASDSAVTV